MNRQSFSQLYSVCTWINILILGECSGFCSHRSSSHHVHCGSFFSITSFCVAVIILLCRVPFDSSNCSRVNFSHLLRAAVEMETCAKWKMTARLRIISAQLSWSPCIVYLVSKRLVGNTRCASFVLLLLLPLASIAQHAYWNCTTLSLFVVLLLYFYATAFHQQHGS